MRTKRLLLVSLIATVGLGIGVVASAADHAQPQVEPLARGEFVDDVAAMFQVKSEDGRTHVLRVNDASDVLVAKITIPDGARVGWHSHSGPVFGVNAGPGTVTSFHGDDCVPEEYPPGSVLFDRGQHSVHGVFNNSGQDVVVYATFLGVQDGALIPEEPPAECDLLP
jgi:quercetin dioxygenase-like cupin family protein